MQSFQYLDNLVNRLFPYGCMVHLSKKNEQGVGGNLFG